MKTAPGLAACCGALMLCAASQARADGVQDGSYGRLSHDAALQLDLGAGPCSGPSTAALARLSLLHLQTAGIYVSFSRDLQTAGRSAATALSLGTELRPLFLPRFLKNLEQGPAWADLTLDSLALFLGAAFDAHADALDSPAFEAGASVGLPLAGRADGAWLGVRALRRWSAAQLGGQSAADSPTNLIAFTIGWQLPLSAGLASHLAQPVW